jgi:hypothetical protein
MHSIYRIYILVYGFCALEGGKLYTDKQPSLFYSTKITCNLNTHRFSGKKTFLYNPTAKQLHYVETPADTATHNIQHTKAFSCIIQRFHPIALQIVKNRNIFGLCYIRADVPYQHIYQSLKWIDDRNGHRGQNTKKFK